MARTLIVAGLALATLSLSTLGAEARGFRFSFRSRPPMPFAERRSPTILLFRKPAEDRSGAAWKATAPDDTLGNIGRPLYTPYVRQPGPAPTPPKKAAPSAHWCDNGTVIGTGAGFCVLKAGGAAS